MGCGAWGANILRDLLALGCRVSVVERTEAKRNAASALRAWSTHPTIEALPPDVEGCVVASPAAAHGECIRRLLPRGIPVFCEKPLTPGVDEARALARETGGPVFVMDKWRYHGGVERLALAVRSGELGRVQRLATRRVQWGQSHTDVDAVWSLAPHDVAIVLHILGEIPAPVAVQGDFTGRTLDGLVALLGSDPGVTIEVSGRQPVAARQITLSCAEGVAVLRDSMADHLEIYRGPARPGAEPERWPISTELPLLAELRWFCAYLRGGPAPLTDLACAIRQLECIEELRRLAEAGRPPS